MPFAPEIIANTSDYWVRNDCRFESYDEAAAYLADLEWRGFAIRETRIVEVTDPVTHQWSFQTVSCQPVEEHHAL